MQYSKHSTNFDLNASAVFRGSSIAQPFFNWRVEFKSKNLDTSITNKAIFK